MKGHIGKKLLSLVLSFALCATAVPMVSLSSSAAGTVTPKVATGQNHTVVLKADGSVWATGYNGSGQLGINKTSAQVEKTATFTQCVDDTGAEIKNAIDIACGYYHTAVIRGNGELWQCGENYKGQLGTGKSGTGVQSNVFEQSKEETSGNAITDATAVACGYVHTAVIRGSGELWQCGRNALDGQLGIGIGSDRHQFVHSQDTNGATITNATAVACGYAHTAVIRGSGELWQCGRNSNGQLGTGDTKKPFKFVQSKDTTGATITNATAVACGDVHTAVIRANGQLWQCGHNDFGQLGIGTSGSGTDKPKFEKSQDKDGNEITDATAVACGQAQTLILRPDANGDLELWGVGQNSYGQLGLGQDDKNAYKGQTKFVKTALEYVLVTIEWGSLTYEYNAKWDPENQRWAQNGNKPLWKATATDADRIKVTNSSTGNINVVLAFQVSDEYAASGKDGTAIEGTFVTTSFGDKTIDNNTLKLPTTSREGIAYLKLSGMSDKITGLEGQLTNQTFGAVTATLVKG